MKERANVDGALKDLFLQDLPYLLGRVIGGRIGIRRFLNVELPKVQERRVDLLVLLDNDTIVHIEIQSTHDPEIVYRMPEYYWLVKRRYKLPLRQVLLYVGEGSVRMPDRIAEDGNLMKWTVVDVREFDAATLIKEGNPGDLALAILAEGAEKQLRALLEKSARLTGSRRDRVLAQILVLAGLRGLVGAVELEMEGMNMVIDITKNPFLMRWQKVFLAEGLAKGKAQGMAEGKAEGKALGKALGIAEGIAKGQEKTLASVLSRQLEAKFGPIPKWAKDRIAKTSASHLDRWVVKVVDASSIESVIGKR